MRYREMAGVRWRVWVLPVLLTTLGACGAPAPVAVPAPPAPRLPTQTLRPVALLPTIPPLPTVAAVPTLVPTVPTLAVPTATTAAGVGDAAAALLPATGLDALPNGWTHGGDIERETLAALACARQAQGRPPLVLDAALVADARRAGVAGLTLDDQVATQILGAYPLTTSIPLLPEDPAAPAAGPCAVRGVDLAALLAANPTVTRVGLVALVDPRTDDLRADTLIILFAKGEG